MPDVGSTSFTTEQRGEIEPLGEPYIPSGIVVRTEGQRMFLHVTGSLAAIAQDLQVRTMSSVHDWKTGKKNPNADARAKIFHAYNIPIEAWDQEPLGTKLPERKDAAPFKRMPTLEHAMLLLEDVHRQRSHPALTNPERAKLMLAEAQILTLRARLEQAAELAEDRIIREHPGFIRLRDALTRALLPYPVAAKAVQEALTKLHLGEEEPSTNGAAS